MLWMVRATITRVGGADARSCPPQPATSGTVRSAAIAFARLITNVASRAKYALPNPGQRSRERGREAVNHGYGLGAMVGKYRHDVVAASGIEPTATVDSIADIPALLSAEMGN